jgi:formylglycine-generating enzyme required for sulfatase activity
MKTKRAQTRGFRFAPVFLLFPLALFLFASCPQPQDGTAGTGPEPPARPAAPLARPGNGRLILSWPAVPGAEAYEVFHGEAGGETEPGPERAPGQTVNVPSAVISGLVNGTSYAVWVRAKNSAGLSGFSPAATGTPAARRPAPSLVRGNGELAVGWAAEDGIRYEVWYGESGGVESARMWAGPINLSGVTAGTLIHGLNNGSVYYVWIKTWDGETGFFGPETAGIPEAPPELPGGDFVYVPGGTINGSNAYAFTLTVPVEPPGYTGAGTTSVREGVFVEDRKVELDSFFMAKYETTQELWYTVQAWAREHGYHFQNAKTSAPGEAGKNKPITGISWRDAIVWCNAYSEMTGREPVYRDGNGGVLRDSRNASAEACDNAAMDKAKNGCRLPTEAEREFAARGGNPGLAAWMYMYAGSNNADEVAWHHGNSAYQIKAAGGKSPNRLGLYDLSGNAQEWCWDWMNWAEGLNPATPADGAAYSAVSPFANQKPFNGGGVGSNVTMSCAAYRWGFTPNYTDSYVGFRVVCTP